MERSFHQFIVGFLFMSALLCGCTRTERAPTTFFTEYGLGPDKWAAAWLLTRHVEQGSRLAVVDPGVTLPQGIPFDLPQSQHRRQGELSTFEVIRRSFDIKDPTVEELGKVIQDIEVFFWMEPHTAHANLIEDAFRGLQLRHGRDAVPSECYLTFFDRVHAFLEQQRDGNPPVNVTALEIDCQQVRSTAANLRFLVPEIPLQHLLDEMARGKQILFIDVREPDEFAESHIPGALNIPLRQVDSVDLGRLEDADYVISYCVKDFRGFEMAKALKERGVRGSAILNPFGLKGWISSGLPVAGTQGLSEAEAARALAECARAESSCRRPDGAERPEEG